MADRPDPHFLDASPERAAARFRQSQSVARIGSWEIELSSGVLWASEEAFRIYGIPVTHDHTLPLAEAQARPLPEDRPALDRALQQLVADGIPYDLKFRIRRWGDGAIRLIHSMAEAVRDASGRPALIAGTVQDITEREERQQRMLAELVQSQKMEAVGRLASGIAHDFNNLLTVILSGCESLLEAPCSPEAREDIEDIRAAGQHASNLAAQLLTFSRRGKGTPVRCDLNAAVERVGKLLRRTLGGHVVLEVIPSRDPWPIEIDPTHLDQVLVNLAVNARDAMARGGRLRIETHNEEDVGAGAVAARWACLVVRDEGSGIPPDVKARLFEPFFTTKREGTGTGLGLSTVLRIVQQAGGRIEVESEPGHGATFRLYFPVASDRRA